MWLKNGMGGGIRMMEMAKNLWELERMFLPFVAQLFAATVVYAYLLKRKAYFWPRLALICLILSQTLLVFVIFIRDAGMEKWVILYVLFCMLVFALHVLGVWLCFEVRAREALYCVTCAYVTEHIVYCQRILLDEWTDSQFFEIGSVGYFLLYAVIYLLVYKLVAKRLAWDGHYATGALYSAGLTIPVLLIVYFMSLYSSLNGLGWLHAIYALVCCSFVLLSQCSQANRLQAQEELHMKERIWRQNKAQYEMSRETIDIINRKCHDLKHQIQALKSIENLQKQREVVEGIEESVMIYETIKNTGNPILDTVLTEKGLLCKENQIVLNIMADGKLLGFMDEIDLYTLFGNALDNAIEANQRLERPGERYINLQVRAKANLVLIRIENPYAGEIRVEEGHLVSLKEDASEHGFGSGSIRHTVEEYGGMVKIETKNQVFVLRVMIPLEEL